MFKILTTMNALNCLVRYLNPADHNLKIIAKADKDFAKRHSQN